MQRIAGPAVALAFGAGRQGNARNSLLQYFPTGCYTICSEQLPLTLYGPPDQQFYPADWIKNGSVVQEDYGFMEPYTITTGGAFQWDLNTGYCDKTSDEMDISATDCSKCGAAISATLNCEPDNPASYQIIVHLSSTMAGTTYTLGTDIGPIDPFSGTLPGVGTYNVTLTFTTLTVPPPSMVTIEVHYVRPDGGECFQEKKFPLHDCTWVDERHSPTDSSNNSITSMNIVNAMTVFPNPTSGDMTVSYDYGADTYQQRSLSVYDETGRKIQYTVPTDVHGNWDLNTTDWTPGIYIIRMEGDGKALQTQRVVVTH